MASSKSRSQILMYSLGAVLVTVLFLALSACAAAEKEEVVLRLNLGGEPRSLDPALATDSISIDVAGSLFVGLTEINEVTSAVEPALAEEWEVSRDGTVYTFRLRRDVRWTDGSRVTAQDVAYGILRTLAPETASEYAYVPAAIIKGGGDYNAGDVTNPGIVGVRVVDDFTLEVELEHPAGYFPSIASMWVMWSQPREAIEAHGDQWIEPANIVTNGP
ncbi:MAG: ABC transporter substrate-binding protein, partial [Dehalococcoidia bacterium]